MKFKLPNFSELLDAKTADQWIRRVWKEQSRDDNIYQRWYQQTGEAGEIFPSQGLLLTPYDSLDYVGKTMMNEEEMGRVLRTRRYILEIFNHPQRLKFLNKTDESNFVPPKTIKSPVMDYVKSTGMALSIADLSCAVIGVDQKRLSRRELLKTGPFVKLGKFARVPFAAGAMPDVFGSPAAIATMAMTHSLAGLPRNGVFSDISRQVKLAEAVFEWMTEEPLLKSRSDSDQLVARWKRNVVGVVEPEKIQGKKRVKALYKAGVRSFRVYSPEPGSEATEMVRQMRMDFGERVEIFAGQVASVKQAMELEQAGTDGLYLGIGGGGRCITAVRSSSVVDWPNLVWNLRGKVSVPLIIEGGASDNVGTSLLLGATGIGVSRSAAGGTIESPGGLMYLVNRRGQWFKPYGGEASARTKYQDGKMLGCGIPAFVEGETTKAIKSYVPHVQPTVAANMYFLIEDVVLSLVFRGTGTITELQNIDPSPLRQLTASGEDQKGTH